MFVSLSQCLCISQCVCLSVCDFLSLDNSGDVIDVDAFLNGGDLSSANILGGGLDAMSAVDVANYGKRIYENAGQAVGSRTHSVDLALTANVIGSAIGTVTILMELA